MHYGQGTIKVPTPELESLDEIAISGFETGLVTSSIKTGMTVCSGTHNNGSRSRSTLEGKGQVESLF